MLQWGRNLTVAEGLCRKCYRWATKELQWGRNLTVAEGVEIFKLRQKYESFNGAAT